MNSSGLIVKLGGDDKFQVLPDQIKTNLNKLNLDNGVQDFSIE